MLRNFLLVTAILAFSIARADQPGTLTGNVRDRSTNEPIPGVTVSIAGLDLGAATNEQGEFILQRVPYGSHTLNVSAVGYTPQRRRVLVNSPDTVRITISLNPDVLSFEEVTATAQRSYSAASAEFMRALDFELRPKQSAQDMLRMVPGLITAQHAGGGKAEQLFLRGFDADHGTDINIVVDGVPVNMVSHGHGQGYADLHFVIPEIIEGLEVFKGPYSAVFGDLATAGSVRLKTRDMVGQNVLRAEAGMFHTYRTVGVLQIPLESNTVQAYIAGELYRTDGYFDVPIDLRRRNVFGKLVSQRGTGGKISVWASGFTSNWNATGQIPERAVAQGLISRFGSIDPSEGGKTERHNVHVHYLSYFGPTSSLSVQGFASRYLFQLFSNFTFFAVDSINGDGIEQADARWLYGGSAELTHQYEFGHFPSVVTVGTSYRADDIDVQLYHQRNRQRLSSSADAVIYQKNLALYLENDVRISEALKLQLGVRSDFFSFRVNDRLTDPAHTPSSGYVRNAIVTPKANAVILLSSGTELFLNVGGGFHSNDARAVVTSKAEQTLPRAWGAEIGARFKPLDGVGISLAVWGLDLESELVYVGDEGTTEINGPTRRLGLDLEVRARINEWLFADADLTLARGRFRHLPEGDNFIPLAPTLTAAGGLTVRHQSGVDAGVRVRHVSDRPANEVNSVIAQGYFLLDLSLAYSLWSWKLQLTGENILNASWNEAQFDTESRLRGEAMPVSELHFTPGVPFNLKLGLEYRF